MWAVIPVAVVVLLAATGMMFWNGSGPPPHVANRLPLRGSIPATLTSEQRQAIEMVYSASQSRRERGVRMMESSHVPPEVAIPYLIALLTDFPVAPSNDVHEDSGLCFFKPDSADVKMMACQALKRIGRPAFGYVSRAFRVDEDRHAAATLANVLPFCDANGAIAVFVDAIQHDENSWVRCIAVEELGTFVFDSTFVLPELDLGKTHADGGRRNHYIDLIVTTMREDPSLEVREGAAFTIIEESDPGTFIQILVDSTEPARRMMAGPPELANRVIEKLIAGLRMPSLRDRAVVFQTLKRVTDEDFGEDAEQWEKWWQATWRTFRISQRQFERERP
jgi:hypothetical protein